MVLVRTLLSKAMLALAIASTTQATPAFAEAGGSGVFSQLVFSFDSERLFSYRYDKGDHSLVIELKNTSPGELGALDHYDERLIRRVLVKDMSPQGTEIKLILRDRDVRAHVSAFTEPFRIAVDLFDSNYTEGRDPLTGLPLVGAGEALRPYNAGSSGGLQFVAPEGNAPIAATGDTASDHPARRRLLQPMPEVFVSPNELSAAMDSTPAGIGKKWNEYPPYVYRLQTASLEVGGRGRAAPAKAVDSAEAMADYAGQLYNLGHENKAMVAYQQVLHKDSTVFDRDALHLWRFAETHLGQGNLSLARGYYQALREKHPESPLAKYASLRMLDVAAIRLIEMGEYSKTPELLAELNQIGTVQNGEMSAQVAIRKAHWNGASLPKQYSPDYLPVVSQDVYNELASAYPTAESARTRYHTATLLLTKMLDDSTPWTAATGSFAADYFKTFTGSKTEPYRDTLRTRLYAKLNMNLQNKTVEGKLASAIQDFESLPSSLKSVEKNAKTAWSLAEAYRNMGQLGLAAEHYAQAAEKSAGPENFKSQFWLSVTAGDHADALASQNKSEAQVNRLRAMSREADNKAMASWNAMNESERSEVYTAYKNHLEQAATGKTKLNTPPKLVLQNWTKALSTAVSTQNGGEPTEHDRHYSPSGGAVIFLADLAKRFAELGMANERRDSINLLRHFKPAELGDDKEAKQLWSNQLVGLAEDYRKNSQYLDAGRLYALVGKEAENWEGRAEALYKGGLLLYRAGRREEALASLKLASEDGNNLYYANLAKERLSQIE